MDSDRHSFLFYYDWYEAIRDLDDNTRLEVLDAVFERAFNMGNNKQQSLSMMSSMAMKFISLQIDRDAQKWQNVKQKRSNAGKKHAGNQYSLEQKGTNGTNVPSVPSMEQNGTNGTNGTSGTSEGVNVNVNVNGNVNVPYKKGDVGGAPLWKESFAEYKRLFTDAYNDLLNDSEFKEQMLHFYPNIDYEKSLEKNLVYWIDEDTWKKVKREHTKTIRPKERLKKNFDKSRIFKPFVSNSDQTQETQTLKDKYEGFLGWLCKERGENNMRAYRITMDDFIEMRKAYPNSHELGSVVLKITEQGVFRQYVNGK